MGVSVWMYCHVVSAGRRWTGELKYILIYLHNCNNIITCMLNTFVEVSISMFSGEQLLLLARRSGRGDGVWEVEGETGASQQSR